MQSFFVGGSLYFIPPPLNRGLATILCDKREISVKCLGNQFLDFSRADSEDFHIYKMRIESSPVFRLLYSLVQSGFYYPVDS
jgi:hypothetical protein